MTDILREPSENNVFLDAEKAFINAFDPEYNSIKYKEYPEGRDGLAKLKYNNIFYRINYPLFLQCKNVTMQTGIYEDVINVTDKVCICKYTDAIANLSQKMIQALQSN